MSAADARAEAERRWPHVDDDWRVGFVEGAEWRAALAPHELDVLNAKRAGVLARVLGISAAELRDSLVHVGIEVRPAEPTFEPRFVAVDEREQACVEAWPGCASGEYDPRCCRFPKSCSVRGRYGLVPRDEAGPATSLEGGER